MLRWLCVLVLILVGLETQADERLQGIACRSVHLGYPAPAGVAFYNEVTIERSAPGTYFMVNGWSQGYFGLQELADGKKLVLFSVWDPAAGDDPQQVPPEKRVQTLHRDESVRVGRFGNEGTGGQAFWDFDWQLAQSYRLLVTARGEGMDRVAYSGYFYEPDRQSWRHLVTFSTLQKGGDTLRGYYSFVEDFRRNRVSTTHERRATFGHGWVRDVAGEWHALTQARFTADANPVLNIDAGLDGSRFFLVTGGKVQNQTPLRTVLENKRPGATRPTDLPQVKDAAAVN